MDPVQLWLRTASDSLAISPHAFWRSNSRPARMGGFRWSYGNSNDGGSSRAPDKRPSQASADAMLDYTYTYLVLAVHLPRQDPYLPSWRPDGYGFTPKAFNPVTVGYSLARAWG